MEADEKKTVMVAIDESEFSRYALQWSLEYLQHTISNCHLILFTAIPVLDFSYIYASTYGAAPQQLITSMLENQKKAAVTLLDKAKDMCAKHGIVAETRSEVGDPKEAICEAVEKLKIHLLVIGSHSRGTIQRAFLGSVSNYCVHNAKCPALVVRKPV
ncbi:hypothetical protein EZV62_018692 [Acer yangbiense]|uniref:UspA domain-containing protein n=1 Tax=Acer yangbiense TaxID=1000413 RepID=A0A5C7HKN3_9ROSI|nr:hypothetical protein EZV62_018692 [Acer yangbiense]